MADGYIYITPLIMLSVRVNLTLLLVVLVFHPPFRNYNQDNRLLVCLLSIIFSTVCKTQIKIKFNIFDMIK